MTNEERQRLVQEIIEELKIHGKEVGYTGDFEDIRQRLSDPEISNSEALKNQHHWWTVERKAWKAKRDATKASTSPKEQ